MNSWHCLGGAQGDGFQLDLARKRVAVARLCQWAGPLQPVHANFGKAMDYSPPGPILLFLFQEALGVERGHAASTRAGNGLAVDVVLNVAGRKNARYAGHGGHALQA